MHSFLHAIGFNKIADHQQLNKLLDDVVRNADNCTAVVRDNGTTVVEYSREFADNIGITVLGEYESDGKFHLIHYYPYLRGLNESCREDITITRRIDTETYSGRCDDLRFGVSLVFYLQNIVDYIQNGAEKKSLTDKGVVLSGLGHDGRIILPTEKNKQEYIEIQKHKEKLFSEIKKGNREAMETLTMEEIDQYVNIGKRIVTEDILSIVETTLIPCSSDIDLYNIIGIINSCYISKNRMTGEKVIIMQICCNNVIFDVCINEKDLEGVPSAGMRFKGTVWMQGHVDFAT